MILYRFWHPHITWTVNWILQICIFFASPISVWGSPSTKKLRTYFMVIFCCCWGLAISITCVIAAGGTNGLCAGSSLDDGAWSFTLQPVNLSIYVCKHNQITISEENVYHFVYYKILIIPFGTTALSSRSDIGSGILLMIVTTIAVTCSRGCSFPKWRTIEIPSSPPSTKLIGGLDPGLMLEIGMFKSANFTSWTEKQNKERFIKIWHFLI